MKDTMTLLLAAAILAAGGFGLYMIKTPDEEDNEQKGGEYDEDSLFNSGSFWGSNKKSKEEDLEQDLEEDLEEEYYEPKARSRGSKTKRNRKATGSKRRYQ